MERKFSFDDMEFVAKSELAEGKLYVGIFDACGDRIHASEQPAPRKGARKGKGASATSTGEDEAISVLIDDFKRRVENGDIDLA